MRGRRIDAPLGNIGQDGRDERVPQGACDPLCKDFCPGVMLAECQGRSALLDAADWDNDGRGAALDEVAKLSPGQFLKPDVFVSAMKAICVVGPRI